ncbi:rhomboid family intramembrane serine protease [soil metagenome]
MTTAMRTTDTRRSGLLLVGAMAVLMWVSETVDAVVGRLDALGIEPRTADGLWGVPFAPFLHAGFGHLIANTVPFLVLGAIIALSGLRRVLLVTLVVALVSGLGTWLFAPSGTLHVGASGVVFGYAAYLIARGLFDRRWYYLVTGLVVALVQGGSLLLGLLPRDGISWQGHLFGALGGLLAARLLARRPGLARG